MLNPTSRILVTGAGGMVGRQLVAHLQQTGHKNITALTRTECDLEDRTATLATFRELKPEFVFHLAAKVGGINANIQDPVGFLHANAHISLNVLEACHATKVQKTLVLGSSCMYPRDCAQPMREESLLRGPLEPTNEGYALAKVMALKLAQYYERQYQMATVNPLASNVYGSGDSFDLEKSHVLSALVKRFVDAKAAHQNQVTLWGTGQARREFLHVHDLARGLLFFMNQVTKSDPINLGSGQDVSIQELAEMISKQVGFTGKIEWDPSRPDGMPRKCMDVSRLNALGFHAKTSLQEGIEEVVHEYQRSAQ